MTGPKMARGSARAKLLPAAQGYRMPAEWEPHQSTWLAWPHFRGDWPGKFEPIPWVYAEIVRNLARHEPVDLIVNDASSEKRARMVLEKAGALSDSVRFHRWRTDRVWTRDSGCIFLTPPADRAESGLLALHFQFNAWAKYPNYKLDEKVGERMAQGAGARVMQPFSKTRRVVLEGGSIDVNGCGTLLTTEECLLGPVQARNPGLSREDLHQIFREYLGAEHVLWLQNGIAGDDTHGHVDDLARFVDPTTVVTVVEENKSDANYEPLQENVSLLREMRDQDGRPLRVETLPMPEPLYFDGQRLPASYANFYIANQLVLVPTFNDAMDRAALNVLAALFPGREVIGIYCGDLVLGLGALHCMTMQQPAQ